MSTLLTNSGKTIIANQLVDLGSAPVYLGVGTGAGSVAVTDTTLFGEVGTRIPCATAVTSTDTANDTVSALGTWSNFSSLLTVTNVGLFDAASGGNLLVKADSVGMVLDTNEGITVHFLTKITGSC